uniref:Secreted protein n=1 Tax=Anguilla anguilla TaxID=7936 RepID=A0A0E9UDQ6_ANGAN
MVFCHAFLVFCFVYFGCSTMCIHIMSCTCYITFNLISFSRLLSRTTCIITYKEVSKSWYEIITFTENLTPYSNHCLL